MSTPIPGITMEKPYRRRDRRAGAHIRRQRWLSRWLRRTSGAHR
jgi:hypothetical protein